MDNINSTFNIAIAIEEVYKVWKLSALILQGFSNVSYNWDC
jgi:hypothetical protein